jgi:internalin A
VLSSNKLEELPSSIGFLTKLKALSISANKLKKLPYEIVRLKCLEDSSSQNALKLSGNPLVEPPIEVAAQGLKSIRIYFESIQSAKEVKALYEAKLIFIGEGEVGKTSLSKTLTNPEYSLEREKRTEGIEINDWSFPVDNFKNTKEVDLHIWDFGGQEIYHSTHQFFLTTRSIYVFVINPRKEENINNNFYWLNIVKLLGGNSPIIVVINKIDQYKKDYLIKEFQEFNGRVVSIVNTSCQTKEGLDNLKDEIKKCLKTLDHLGTPLDKRWIQIRQELTRRKNEEGTDYISYQELENLCYTYELSTSDVVNLTDIFNALGIVIHYRNDIRLQNLVILNPEWATQGVYKILDDRKIIEAKGRFSETDLERIWTELKFRYKKAELLALMEKFELCFKINTNEFLATQLLSKEPVKYDWNHKDNLTFEYNYSFMPKGILGNFIVKRNEDICDSIYWLNGVLLQWNETRAIITEEYHNRQIKVKLIGKEKRQLLAIIRKTFEEIHSRYKGIKVQEYLGCICSDCQKGNPYLFGLENLILAKDKNVKVLQCQKSFEEISLINVLSFIEEGGDEDGLKGSYFERVVKELLKSYYPNAEIRHGVKLGKFEYDFVLISPDYKEIVIVEAKGYKSSKKIALGDKESKQTVEWFFGNTYPAGYKILKEAYQKNPLYENFQLKACYITSCGFHQDAIEKLEKANKTNLKPSQLKIYLDRKSLIEALKEKGLSNLLNDLNRYYS